MNRPPRGISLEDWDHRYAELVDAGLCEPAYGGPLRRHAESGDRRLTRLRLDNSAAALRLWNFLLTEEQRLRQAREAGWQILGTLKDLGTVPVMAYALQRVVAFYPDGAWWLPCLMENQTRVLQTAGSLGIDDSFCPVRAMLGAFANQAHFPLPALEMLVAEMLAIHFCSDQPESVQVLEQLLAEVRARVAVGQGVLPPGASSGSIPWPTCES